MDTGDWLVAHAVNILNVRNVDVSGDLRAMQLQRTALSAHVDSTFAGQNVNFTVDFLPGQGEKLVQLVFEKLMANAKDGVIKIGKRTGLVESEET